MFSGGNRDGLFNIYTNRKLGLIGRNVKGKSTFLKLLQGKYKVIFNPTFFEVINRDRVAIVGKIGISKLDFDTNMQEMSGYQKKIRKNY